MFTTFNVDDDCSDSRAECDQRLADQGTALTAVLEALLQPVQQSVSQVDEALRTIRTRLNKVAMRRVKDQGDALAAVVGTLGQTIDSRMAEQASTLQQVQAALVAHQLTAQQYGGGQAPGAPYQPYAPRGGEARPGGFGLPTSFGQVPLSARQQTGGQSRGGAAVAPGSVPSFSAPLFPTGSIGAPYQPSTSRGGEARPGGFGLPAPGSSFVPLTPATEGSEDNAPVPPERLQPPTAAANASVDTRLPVAPQATAPGYQSGPSVAPPVPISQVDAADFLSALCQCLQASKEELPVDLDQPLAFLFGERSDAWHQQANAWYGGALGDVLSSDGLAALIALRESREKGS